MVKMVLKPRKKKKKERENEKEWRENGDWWNWDDVHEGKVKIFCFVLENGQGSENLTDWVSERMYILENVAEIAMMKVSSV